MEPVVEGSESLKIYAVVKGKEGDENWKDVAEVVSVSASGAGFYIDRECRVGGLVSLLLPMETELRFYDKDAELYRVWGLVQHCSKRTNEDGEVNYHVGVAFTGKHPPESYRTDPMQNYRICGMGQDGLWRIEEAKAPFKTRQHMRYWKAFDVYLALADGNRTTATGERTTTENISKSGAAVISTLDVNVGDRVKFISEQYDFSGLAVICNRQVGEDKRTRLHLQFVGNSFPIETLKLDA